MYTNLTCQDVSFTVATLSNILNDKHIPQKNAKTAWSDTGEENKKCSEDSVERVFLSCEALRIQVKICLTKQEKRKSYQMTNMKKMLISNNNLIL